MKVICDWKDCKEVGSYKAPVEKDNSKKYRLLCLEHIKIFNKNWNYFENMNSQEVEYFIKSDLTWHKSTKISQTDRDALQVMGLSDEVKWEQIQLKFKELVKKYHPDKNQGSKEFEDKLKKITLAYSQLKKTLGKK